MPLQASSSRAKLLVPQAVVFELSLGLLGAVLALGLEEPLRERLVLHRAAIVRGVVVCAPLLAMLLLLGRSRWEPLARLRRQVEQMVDWLFDGASIAGLAAVSASAGLGEEILFRGALQPLITGWTSPMIGLISISLLFGLVHAASAMYFALATLVGLYFGWLAQHYNDLVAPIIAHGLYDFAALLYLRTAAQDTSRVPSDADSSDSMRRDQDRSRSETSAKEEPPQAD